jgi:ligand-binding SRPBCC domain-containing protein
MRYTYRTEQWLPHPVAGVFALLANPGNLPRLMPAWQAARIDDASIVPPPIPPTPSPRPAIAAGVGTRLRLSFKPFPHAPFRVAWHAEITEFVWNHHFCDRQLRGPFTFWNHCHTVQPVTRNGIAGASVVDEVEYQLPLGPLGRLAHRLWLHRQIEISFAHRKVEFAALIART